MSSEMVLLITSICTLIAAGISAFTTQRTRSAIQEVHLSLNSRLDELLVSREAVAKQSGKDEANAAKTKK